MMEKQKEIFGSFGSEYMKVWYQYIGNEYLESLKNMKVDNIRFEREELNNIITKTKEKLDLIEDFIHHKCGDCNELCDEIFTAKDDSVIYQCPKCKKLIRDDNRTRCGDI